MIVIETMRQREERRENERRKKNSFEYNGFALTYILLIPQMLFDYIDRSFDPIHVHRKIKLMNRIDGYLRWQNRTIDNRREKNHVHW